MNYKIELKKEAKKDLEALDKPVQKRVKELFDKLEKSDNPKVFGKQLSENLVKLWSYKVGKYRVIAEIQENKLVILVVSVGKRETIYDKTDKRLNK